MTTTASHWHEHARRLADAVTDQGVLHDPAWRAALRATPRHIFVPRFYRQRADGGWDETALGAPGFLDAVYRDEPLVTALAAHTDGQRVTLSSSTKPGLMVRMLEALEIAGENRVLEIGTGTGYNAALLTHRLGGHRVFSVDIDTELVTRARTRLHQLDLAPTVVTADGAAGLVEYAPFDRIIATCSVTAVPWAWADQLTEGGRLLVDLKPNTHAGNLALLHKHADRLEGRFLSKWAGFMAMRAAGVSDGDSTAVIDDGGTGARSRTQLDPHPASNLVPWFLAQSELPPNLIFGYQDIGVDGPQWAVLATPDGSRCAVAMRADADGYREVHQSGPRAIWDTFEHAYRTWDRLGRPGWKRLGLTVQPDGRHTVWLDTPNGAEQWELIPSR